jgi:ABC-type dipeptide/oligopeptide/nickel transport system permease component
MLRHALRRLLWIVPILIGVTIVSFALLSYVPDPADEPASMARRSADDAIEMRRERFLDLPRFVNERPQDVRVRVDGALELLLSDGADSERGRETLVKLGGAALPYLLPRLDTLDSAARGRVAIALAKVAERMGISSAQLKDRAQAVAFWNRFWADRAIDFRPANARRAARRLAMHPTSTRQTDLLDLDTYALDQIMELLTEMASSAAAGFASAVGGEAAARDSDKIAWNSLAAARLVDAASHVSERSDRIAEGATDGEAFACVRRWQRWWQVHRSDYTALTGSSRVLAVLTETQYARWAERVIFLGVGTGDDGVSTLRRLRLRAGPTLLLSFGAVVTAYGLALGLGVIGALRSRRAVNLGVISLTLTAYAIPTACLAVFHAPDTGHAGSTVAAILTLACALIAAPFLQIRLGLSQSLRHGYVQLAKASGAGPRAAVLGTALRNAVLPIVALGSVEMPTALGGAFVVERAFGMAGLGSETVRAVQTHDVAWLVGLAFVTALLLALTSIAGDLLVAVIDPRLSLAVLRHRRTTE